MIERSFERKQLAKCTTVLNMVYLLAATGLPSINTSTWISIAPPLATARHLNWLNRLSSEICVLRNPWLPHISHPFSLRIFELRAETGLRLSLALAAALHVGDRKKPADLHFHGRSQVACLASLANPLLPIPNIRPSNGFPIGVMHKCLLQLQRPER